jgi:hypothetical protein
VQKVKVKVKVNLQQAMKAQRGRRCRLYSFFNLSSRWGGWSTPRPDGFTPRNPVPVLQEAGWASGPVWTGAENLFPPPGFDPRIPQPVASRYTG